MSIFIARIKEVNPVINAVVSERFAEAIEEARRVDKMLDSEESSGLDAPFLGVPFTAKEAVAIEGKLHWFLVISTPSENRS